MARTTLQDLVNLAVDAGTARQRHQGVVHRVLRERKPSMCPASFVFAAAA